MEKQIILPENVELTEEVKTLYKDKDGEFTAVKKVPRGETQETTVNDEKNLFQGDCTIEKAQQFLDEKYPNHLVISVRDEKYAQS